jgi:hypothetical protein
VSAYASGPLSLIRQDRNDFNVRVPIPNAGDETAEWRMQNLQLGGTNNWRIEELKVVGTAANYILSNSTSVWEYAYMIGLANDPASSTNWQFIGGGHGNETPTGYRLTADGIDETGLSVGSTVSANSVVFTQDFKMLLPKDHSQTVATVHLVHTFNTNGLLVQHSHIYNPGYQMYNEYSAMMPVTDDINTVVIGNGTPHTVVFNGVAYFLGTSSASGTAYSTNQPYALTMSLPSGGPDDNGYWGYDSGPEYYWLLDEAGFSAITAFIHIISRYISRESRREVGSLTYNKFYVNWVSSQYANRITPPASSSHSALYRIKILSPDFMKLRLRSH